MAFIGQRYLSSNSICSGCVARIISPFRFVNQPRTRKLRPVHAAGSRDALSNKRRDFLEIEIVKSVRQSDPKLR